MDFDDLDKEWQSSSPEDATYEIIKWRYLEACGKLINALHSKDIDADELNQKINPDGYIDYSWLCTSYQDSLFYKEIRLLQALDSSIETANVLNSWLNEDQRVDYEKLKSISSKLKPAVEIEKSKREERLQMAFPDSLEAAYRLNLEINYDGLVNYEALCNDYLVEWLGRNVRGRASQSVPDAQQLVAIGSFDHSFLLRARAGSGKTSVIVNKATTLLLHDKLEPDELLILAFNREASKEIRDRLKSNPSLVNYDLALTFHSLAYKTINKHKDIVQDTDQKKIIHDGIKEVLNPAYLKILYEHFRKEVEEVDTLGELLSEGDYFLYRRNRIQETLGGAHVKSIGEKWIGDFLFEHGIEHVYERTWFWDHEKEEGAYRPDFSLFLNSTRTPDVVIEHWGLDPDDGVSSVPEYWDISTADYRSLIEKKRGYWIEHNQKRPDQKVTLLETSIADTIHGREFFENLLREKIETLGTTLARCPDDELIERVVRKKHSRLSQMCLQYIQRAKKQMLTPGMMSKKIDELEFTDAKTQAFLTIANRVYGKYEENLVEQKKMDFDDLMTEVIEEIHTKQGECHINIKSDRSISMNRLKWILIDEYQDFSPLFSELIQSLRKYNEEVRIFCVGDDWQAINGFAGSSTRYFHQFQKDMPKAKIRELQGNYRSAKTIVGLGNRFMAGKGGSLSTAMRDTATGSYSLHYTASSDVFLQQRPGKKYEKERIRDEKFGKDPSRRYARIMKKCLDILSENKDGSNTTFAILSRTRRIGPYEGPREFLARLKWVVNSSGQSSFPDFDQRVKCDTVHSFKGKEADVVILLDVNQNRYPLIHPDNELFDIFGITPAEVLAEEEHLFYVAITRARRSIYFLSDRRRESEFLKRLGLKIPDTN